LLKFIKVHVVVTLSGGLISFKIYK
jgi:hypothetical protein